MGRLRTFHGKRLNTKTATIDAVKVLVNDDGVPITNDGSTVIFVDSENKEVQVTEKVTIQYMADNPETEEDETTVPQKDQEGHVLLSDEQGNTLCVDERGYVRFDESEQNVFINEEGKLEVNAVSAELTVGITTATEPPVVKEEPKGFFSGTGVLYVALVIVLAVLAVLVVDTVNRGRKKARKPKHRREKPQFHPVEDMPPMISAEPEEITIIGANMKAGIPVEAAAFHDIGAREDQQDSLGMSEVSLYHQQGVLAVVADGMGGLSNGKAVSNALMRTFVDGFNAGSTYSRCSDVLLDLAMRANAQINQMLQGAERSGSTLVAAMVKDGYLHFLTVGDSRLYLYRSGTLLQLNREHIYQEELAVKAVNRMVTIQQVSGDRQAQSLTSFFGIGRIPYMDRNNEGIKLIPGDRLLLASDGVFGTLLQEQMEQALTLPLQEAAQQMGAMVRSANKPYQDNNTGLILEYRG